MKRIDVEYNGEEIKVWYTIDQDDPSTGYRGEGVVVEMANYKGVDVSVLIGEELAEVVEKRLKEGDC